MRRGSALLGVIAVFAVSGCESPIEPPAPAVSISLSQGGDEKLSAKGHGLVDLTAVPGAGYAEFKFDAKVQKNGSVKGTFRQSRVRNGLLVEFEGEVTCLTVDAALGRARIGGVVTKNNSTDPAFLTANHEVGDDVWFRVQEGDGESVVDASTTYGFKPTLVQTSAEYCALPFTGLPWWNPASTFPLSSGHIKVRP